MYFDKRYQGTERDEGGRLLCTFGFNTPEDFDRHIERFPAAKGHSLELHDTWTALDYPGEEGYYWQMFDDGTQRVSQLFDSPSEAWKARRENRIIWN